MNTEVFRFGEFALTIVSNGTAVTDIIRGDAACDGETDAVTHYAADELSAYFSGRLREFSTPVELTSGVTDFQHRVWCELREIPFGEVASYGEIARRVGKPGAARAVGNAVGANPILIMVPCHRVVASTGIGGFSSGLDLKQFLLRTEGIYGAI